MRPETTAVHGGYTTEPTTKAVAVPIYQTVAYEFDSAEHAALVFDLEVEGNIYNRMMNPTNAVLERRVAALEGGNDALTYASGAAATVGAILNLAEQGRNVVSTPQLYGATYTLFAHILPRQGIEVRFAASDDADAVAGLLDERSVAVFCESVGNPAGNVVDVEAFAEVAHAGGVPLIVDNTVPTPCLLRPIEWGADLVVHSLTKFMGGHGTTLGGAIVDSGRFSWTGDPERFRSLNEPEPSFHGVVYTERFGSSAFVARCRTVGLRNTGATLSPFAAFLLLQGIETLPLRVERHCENALRVAEYLRDHRDVAWVEYAGLPESRYHELARKYMDGRCPSLLTFGLKGGYEAGVRFFDSLALFKRLVNIGDTKSLACHPASTTHRQLTPGELELAGVTPEMLRLCVGIEHIDDILADLEQALAAARAG
jgi:O-acetylhomoserine (thiol)-lyase